MPTVTPTLNIDLKGKGLVTEYSTVKYLSNFETKKEQIYSLNTGDGAELIDVSDISNINLIMFLCDTAFDLTIVTTTETIVFNCDDMFILTPTSDFINKLTSISITATSTTTKQLITAKIYGVSA